MCVHSKCAQNAVERLEQSIERRELFIEWRKQRVEPRVRAIVHGRLPADLRRRVDSDDIYQSTMSVALREIASVEYLVDDQVVATGDATETGRIADLMATVGNEPDVNRRDGRAPSSCARFGGGYCAGS